MGLCVLAYETATLTDPHDRTEECYDDGHVRAFIIDPSFHRSLRGLVADRCYEVSGHSEHIDHSYSGYGDFRERISAVFLRVGASTVWSSPDEYAIQPFFELIHFADNEGTIGPEAAADLLADFEAGRPAWISSPIIADDPMRNQYVWKYDEWTEVFRIAAAGGGLVRFG